MLTEHEQKEINVNYLMKWKWKMINNHRYFKQDEFFNRIENINDIQARLAGMNNFHERLSGIGKIQNQLAGMNNFELDKVLSMSESLLNYSNVIADINFEDIELTQEDIEQFDESFDSENITEEIAEELKHGNALSDKFKKIYNDYFS